MAENLSNALARLPFVSENSDGTLNLWDPKPTYNFEIDFNCGRSAGAMLLHVLRKYENPNLFFHIDQAWRESGGQICAYRQGVQTEVASAISMAPSRHPELARAAHLKFDGSCLASALGSLPFVRINRDGAPDFSSYSVAGDRLQRLETGKYYGAAICRLIQATMFINFFCEEPGRPLSPEEEDVMLGLNYVLAEVSISSPADGTKYQRAALEFMSDDTTDITRATINAL